MSVPFDLTHQEFDRLTVLERVKNNEHGHICWLCQCVCGNMHVASTSQLRSKNTRSCGCLSSDTHTTHGMASYTQQKLSGGVYETWKHMLDRCNNEANPDYDNYGGRGIYVCPRWDSVLLFFEDMGRRPLGCSIDRIDNEGPYSPENCRWATRSEQNNNRRSNRWLVIDGERKTLTQWATDVSVPYRTILARINRGWSDRDAVFTPSGSKRTKVRT